MKKFIALLLLCLFLPVSNVLAIEKNSKRNEIEKLLKITNALGMGKQMSEMFTMQLTQMLKSQSSDIPPKLFDIVQTEVNTVIDNSLPGFAEQIVPLYDKQFTSKELKQMIRFYESEVGKKSVRVMPIIMQQSMALGQKWAQSVAMEVQARVTKKLQQEGINIKM